MTVSIEDRVPPGRRDVPLRPNGERVHSLSAYDPRYCDRVLELGRQGKTYAEICADIGTSKQRSDIWCGRYEEYQEAIWAALTASEAHYNAMGYRNIEWVNNKGETMFRDPVWRDLKSEFKPIITKEDGDKEADEAADTIIKSVARRIQKGETNEPS